MPFGKSTANVLIGSSHLPKRKTSLLRIPMSRSNGSKMDRSMSRPTVLTATLPTRGTQTAIIWEGDNPDDSKHITYAELHAQVCKLSNVYKSMGVGKGDRVVLYLPMIPEAAYAMLACARIGAIHSIVFAGFSPEALAARVDGCKASLVVTADEAPRGGPQHAPQNQCRQGA
jgi:acyl-coenzyme A synthetase/AMP-(fatty) acid ligase